MPGKPIIFLWTFATACSSGDVFLSTDGIATCLFVAVDGDQVQLDAFDIPAETLIRYPAPESGMLYALGYIAPIDRLALRPGRQLITPQGEALPPADRLQLLGGREWQLIDELPPVIDELRVASLDGCATFDHQARSLPRTDDLPAFAVPLDDHRVLVGSVGGRFQVHELARSYV